MSSESDNQNKNTNTEQRHSRFRDGIIWGVVASFSLFFLNPFMVIPTALVFAGIAGYRGKSIRPALGTILTVFLIAGVGILILYNAIYGINN